MKKVVVVEDDLRNMKLFRVLLRTIPNIEVYEAWDGIKGLELIKEIKPDLIILDIKLPSLSGIEICRKLRALIKFRDTPIIAATAFAMEEDEERILDAGFNTYISKPLNTKKFKAIVKAHLELD
ncbi:MAG: response regulator [Candidatus Lokiarchaeota archaeon]|nr:response regulator [Candidatus Lokiarchaeota archaeon]